MGGQPLRTTANEDVVAFQAERTIFLDEERKFKFGKVIYGLPAANSLKSMYMELVYSTHEKQNKTAAEEYVGKLDTLSGDMAKLLNDSGMMNEKQAAVNKKYRERCAELDALYLEFKRIKRDCGFG